MNEANIGISITHDGGLAKLTLDIDRENALTVQSMRTLARVIEEAEDLAASGSVRALILESARSGVFSQGLNLAQLAKLDDIDGFLSLFYNNLRRLYCFPFPTIAAVSGHAIGYGCMLALMCDYRLVVDGGARIGLPEVKVGIRVPRFAILRLQQITSPRFADQHVLLGAAFKPEEALSSGFADRLLPAEKLSEAAIALGRKFRAVSGQALRRTKTATRMSPGELDAIIADDLKENRQSLEDSDSREGFAAVQANRRPVFA